MDLLDNRMPIPITPIAKSGARFIGIVIDDLTRFLFAGAVEQVISANSIAVLETKVVDKIGYPRAVNNNNNGLHIKKFPFLIAIPAV